MNQTIQAVYFLYLKYDMLTCLADIASQIGEVVATDTNLAKLGDHAISMAVVEVIQKRATNFEISNLYGLRKDLKGFINEFGN